MLWPPFIAGCITPLALLCAACRPPACAACLRCLPALPACPPSAGLIDPEGFDDFRVVLGEGSLGGGQRG